MPMMLGDDTWLRPEARKTVLMTRQGQIQRTKRVCEAAGWRAGEAVIGKNEKEGAVGFLAMPVFPADFTCLP